MITNTYKQTAEKYKKNRVKVSYVMVNGADQGARPAAAMIMK
jgi:hypothetical protein